MAIFPDAQGRLTSQFEVKFGRNSKLIQAFMVVLLEITFKNENDPIKNERDRVLTEFSPL